MSVTIGFAPLALAWLAINGTHLAIGAVQSWHKAKLSEKLRQEQEKFQILVNASRFPNLNASRQTASTRQDEPVFTRETFIQDLNFARETAESLGGKVTPLSDGIHFTFHGLDVVLYRENPETAYQLWIIGTAEPAKAAEIADEIGTEYRRLVQSQVHAALLEHSKEFGMTLESEEIQKDQSIVLTFTL